MARQKQLELSLLRLHLILNQDMLEEFFQA